MTKKRGLERILSNHMEKKRHGSATHKLVSTWVRTTRKFILGICGRQELEGGWINYIGAIWVELGIF
jgi:hypothetical protein